nr:hypothetical protein [uncultured Allomuricauda sp.]
MITPLRLASKIYHAHDFKEVIWSNYLEYSNGITMKEYAINEKAILLLGNYGVEEFHQSVNQYFKFLNRLIG